MNLSKPSVVSGLAAASLVWVGETYSCSKLSAAFQCWGANSSGQLGIGNTTTLYKTPQPITSILAGSSTSGGFGSHNCATDSSGSAYCWGLNSKGQLGNNSTTGSSVPVVPNGMSSGVASLSGGMEFSCALSSSASLKCWGDNTFKQLGNSSASSLSTVPLAVSGMASGVLAVASGAYHNCAVLTGAMLKCWGRNDYNQLGSPNASSTADQSTPVIVDLP